MFSNLTYNAWTESVADKPYFRNAWKYNKFCLVTVQAPQQWQATLLHHQAQITVAGIYDDAVIVGTLVFNAYDQLRWPSVYEQFLTPKDEMRSIIVIPEQYGKETHGRS